MQDSTLLHIVTSGEFDCNDLLEYVPNHLDKFVGFLWNRFEPSSKTHESITDSYINTRIRLRTVVPSVFPLQIWHSSIHLKSSWKIIKYNFGVFTKRNIIDNLWAQINLIKVLNMNVHNNMWIHYMYYIFDSCFKAII